MAGLLLAFYRRTKSRKKTNKQTNKQKTHTHKTKTNTKKNNNNNNKKDNFQNSLDPNSCIQILIPFLHLQVVIMRKLCGLYQNFVTCQFCCIVISKVSSVHNLASYCTSNLIIFAIWFGCAKLICLDGHI